MIFTCENETKDGDGFLFNIDITGAEHPYAIDDRFNPTGSVVTPIRYKKKRPRSNIASDHELQLPFLDFNLETLTWGLGADPTPLPCDTVWVPASPKESDNSCSPPPPSSFFSSSSLQNTRSVQESLNDRDCEAEEEEEGEVFTSKVKPESNQRGGSRRASLKSDCGTAVLDLCEDHVVIDHSPHNLDVSCSPQRRNVTTQDDCTEHRDHLSHSTEDIVSTRSVYSRSDANEKSDTQEDTVQVDDMDGSDMDECSVESCTVPNAPAPPNELDVLSSVKLLNIDEIDRECMWLLWLLQDALGDRFPSTLKRVPEPGVSCVPLRSLRYTASLESSFVPPSFWTSSEQPVSAGQGVLELTPDDLYNLRSMLNYPNLSPNQSPYVLSCRYCDSVECAQTRRHLCRRARCARCYREGHSTQRCYQEGAKRWESHFLAILDEVVHKLLYKRCLYVDQQEYFKSLNYCMSKHRHHSRPKLSCITCCTVHEPICRKVPHRHFLAQSSTRFRVLSCEDVLRELGSLYSYIRWDADASPFQRYSSMPRSRYSLHLPSLTPGDLEYPEFKRQRTSTPYMLYEDSGCLPRPSQRIMHYSDTLDGDVHHHNASRRTRSYDSSHPLRTTGEPYHRIVPRW